MGRVLIIGGSAEEARRLIAALASLGQESWWDPEGQGDVAGSPEGLPGLVIVAWRGDDAPRGAHRLRLDPSLGGIPLVRVGGIDPPVDEIRVGPIGRLPGAWTDTDLRQALDDAAHWRESLDDRGVDAEVEIEFRSLGTHLVECCESLLGLLRATPLRPEQVRQVRHSLLEVGQNALEWGNRLDPEKRVWVTYRAHAEYIELVVRDEGPGFDPSHLPQAAAVGDPLAHLEVRERMGLRDGGFGLMICRGMVDEFRHNPVGNEVTLTKYFATATSSARERTRSSR